MCATKVKRNHKISNAKEDYCLNIWNTLKNICRTRNYWMKSIFQYTVTSKYLNGLW